VSFSADLHRLESIKHMEDDQTFSLTQDFVYYEGYRGDNMEAKNMSSGAYLFRPINNQKISVTSDPPVLETYTGELT
jgi:lysosomal alpha-mannosidase